MNDQVKVLYVYKGFTEKYIMENVKVESLVENIYEKRINVLHMNDDYKRKLMSSLMNTQRSAYVHYEEFILIQELGADVLYLSGFRIVIHRNTMFPEYYLLESDDDELKRQLNKFVDYGSRFDEIQQPDSEIIYLQRFYGDVKYVQGLCFISYKNDERLLPDITIKDTVSISEAFTYNSLALCDQDTEFIFELNQEVDSYLDLLATILNKEVQIIGLRIMDIVAFTRQFALSFKALLNEYSNITFVNASNEIKTEQYRPKLQSLLNEIWGHKEFKQLEFYKNPDANKEKILISQGQIIEDIIYQAEMAHENKSYRDVFITAPTGAGKSVIFQIAALYLAKEYNKLSIIISPLIALMKDQVENISKCGIDNVAYINSELNFIEKENVLANIKNGKVDVLYLAPETLLAYSIDTFIGNREVGLFIVDEAHIVTTWGKGFRPDYWYLGKYISKVRSEVHRFPIVTFTATAVYGGNDDMYDETIESLNMRATNKYLGTVKREDISFQITNNFKKVGKEEYQSIKLNHLVMLLNKNITANKKTIVYFPYASLANDMIDAPEMVSFKNSIALYTGKMNKISKQFEADEFKSGSKLVMFATKAFGMGIDINDIEYVYHYAPTGNLNDYVQEIGRSARKIDITGIAGIDFMANDFKFINMLFGMSSIKQYEVRAVLKKLSKIYQYKQQQNFLVTPNDFSFIFSSESKEGTNEIERKLKTVLLMLEKDLTSQFGFPVLISRPKSLFSKIYVVIDREECRELLSSKYGEFFKKVSDGRNHERRGHIEISDVGDVYVFDMKQMWEKHFPNLSFANFKYQILDERAEIDFPYKKCLHQRFRISIQTNENIYLDDLKIALVDEVNKVNNILDAFKDASKMFTIQEFANELRQHYPDKDKAMNIASSYVDLVQTPISDHQVFHLRFIEYNKAVNKYRIVNRGYNNVNRSLILRSDLLNKINRHEFEMSFYYPKTNKKDFDLFRTLYLIELFGLGSYEIIGGESPEVFIRLNDPKKVGRLSGEHSNYKNLILKSVKKRHEHSKEILTKFYTEIDSDYERWEFIENYFLGQDMEIHN